MSSLAYHLRPYVSLYVIYTLSDRRDCQDINSGIGDLAKSRTKPRVSDSQATQKWQKYIQHPNIDGQQVNRRIYNQ